MEGRKSVQEEERMCAKVRPEDKGSSACVGLWQKENMGGRQSWEKHHEMSQESRLKPNHTAPTGHVKDSEFYPSSSMGLQKSCKQKSDLIKLALTCIYHSSSRRSTIGEGKCTDIDEVSYIPRLIQTKEEGMWCWRWRECRDLAWVQAYHPLPGWLRESHLTLWISVFLFNLTWE